MNLNKILKWIIFAGIFVIPFIPLLITTSMFFPFITGKNFVFRIITEIVFASWVILAIRDYSYRIKFSWVLTSVTAFVGVIALADIFGENPAKSFWSNFERMEGFVALVHLLAYSVVVGSVLNTQKLWERFLQTSIGVSLATAIYGLFQLGGILDTHQGNRLDATLGNASYLAIYMFFHIFILAFLMFRNGTSRFLQKIYGAIILIETIVLYHTATRGTILGFMGALILVSLLIALFGKEYPKARKISAGIIAGLIVLVGGFFALKNTEFVQTSPVLSRFASISPEERTTQSRFIIWGMAYEGFKEHPVFGWGQENFNLVFNKYYKPELWQQEPWFDRAHNVFFDWLTAGGLLGLLAYLSIFVSMLYYLWRREGNNFSLFEKSIMTGLLAGYFFHNIFVFDNIVSYIMFFSIIGYLHSVNAKPSHKEPRVFKEQASMVIASIMVVVLGVSVYFFNIRGIATAHALIGALSAQEGGVEKNLEFYEKAFSYAYSKTEVREQLLQATSQVSSLNVSDEIKQRFFNMALSEMKLYVEEEPKDIRPKLFLSSFLNNFGRYDEAIVYAEQALEQSPNKQAIRFSLANAYLNKGDFEKASQLLKEAFDLDPSYPDARIAYASSLVFVNKLIEAEQLLIEGFGTAAVDNNLLLNAYGEKGRYDLVTAIWQQKVEKDPNNPQFRLSLAASYIQVGQRQKAIDEIQKVIELNPDFREQGEFYISEIKAGRNP